MVESTPLLVGGQDPEAGTAPRSDGDTNHTNVSTKEGRPRLLATIKILRVHAFVISLFTFFLLLAIYFILYHAPLHSPFGLGPPKRRTAALGGWIFAAIILSLVTGIISVFSKFSISSTLVAIVVDIVLAVGIIVTAVRFTHQYPHSLWCRSTHLGEGRYEQPHPECWTWLNLSWVLMKVSFWLAIILIVIFVILAVLQIVAIYKTNSRRAISWSDVVPYSLKINISLQKKDSEVQTLQTSEASLGQGPVHL